jgi:hypothetical protein
MNQQHLICPDCNTSPLIDTYEDGQMIFSCENCGWLKIENNFFYLTAWEVQIRQALAPIDILESLLTDKDTTKFLKPRLKGVSHLSNYEIQTDEYLVAEISIAYQIYLKQMIVLATTYVEQILKDFFKCLFNSKPQRMNTYLSSDGKGKAIVTLNEVLIAPSREEIIFNLVERAVTVAVGPKFDKIVGKIIKECQLKLDRPFVEDLRALNEQRNRIIHEDTIEEINIQQVHNSFGLLLYLLYILGCAANEYNIPCIDECGFLDDFDRQLRESKKEQNGGANQIL